ncbi:MlaE family ABC transporter permease [Desulforhopalus singaporensis]|uniref:Phospholipid/cholesterol/gamma-HCH transport system permease protein n=1 Tax=Desulforhopalus singaporensis TaxID=91360 RepID=A0A1H0MLE9_9BACT|nr:ABC transporter permease [Desulforhopalus singaporensis]SDO81232.1 phospholipid/cholesterol/gamma-HCH transport system permease protein [Desulforhopalus singaporensis]
MITDFLAKLGNTGLYVLTDLGRMTLFLLQALMGIFRRPFRFRELLRQLRFIGVGSLAVIFFTAISTGMVLGLQGYYSLNKFGAEGMLGSAVSLTLIMELGPVLTALMVAGRAGSAMCAELGIMRISEQIDALDCMAVDPFRYLISPKFMATIISIPLLTALFDVIGIAGGYVAGVGLMDVSPGSYIDGMKTSVTNHDIWLGTVKSCFFALLVVWISCGRGYFVQQIRGAGFGAESVSRVTTQAVVLSSISVLVFDYLLTAVLL